MLPGRVYCNCGQHGGDGIMSFITECLLRFCAGGFCCAAAITLVGPGAKREITRIACSCVMLIICFSCIREVDVDWEAFRSETDLQEIADHAVADRTLKQKEAVDAALERYMKEEITALGYSCDIKVESKVEEGEYQVIMVTIFGENNQAFPEVEHWLMDSLKIKRTQIRWEEAP